MYVKMHKDAHIILEGLTDAHYPGIYEQSKIKHLFNSIKTAAFDTVKVTIWENTTLRMDFEGTIDLFKKFITWQKTGSYGTNNFWEASATQYGGGGRGGRGYQG